MRLAVLVSLIALVFAVGALALDGLSAVEKAELAKILGKKLKLFQGCHTFDVPSRQKRQASGNDSSQCNCHTCLAPQAGNDTIMGALGDQSFSYDLDDNGCPQLTITCGGYGNVALMVNTPVDEFALLNVTGGDPDEYSEITAVLDCMEYGWAGSEPDFAFRDNVITCGADSDEPPCECAASASTTAAYPYYKK